MACLWSLPVKTHLLPTSSTPWLQSTLSPSTSLSLSLSYIISLESVQIKFVPKKGVRCMRCCQQPLCWPVPKKDPVKHTKKDSCDTEHNIGHLSAAMYTHTTQRENKTGFCLSPSCETVPADPSPGPKISAVAIVMWHRSKARARRAERSRRSLMQLPCMRQLNHLVSTRTGHTRQRGQVVRSYTAVRTYTVARTRTTTHPACKQHQKLYIW